MNNTPIVISIISVAFVILTGIGAILYRVGKTEQKLTSKIETLETGRAETASNQTKILEELTSHCKDESLHVNVKLQEHLQQEQREWRSSVDHKLTLLLTSATKRGE